MTSILRLSLSALPATALALAACGGDVVTNAGGSGGTSTVTGGGGSGGEEAPCPADKPTGNTTCSVEHQTCTYPVGCCADVYQCEGGHWLPVPVDCIQPDMCPVEMPFTGLACDVCVSSGPCTYDCPAAPVQVSATCGDPGKWTVGECPVPPPVDCGGEICAPGEICVESAGGAGFFYSCAKDPCAPAALSCACAGELCGSSPFECNGVDPAGVLLCSCPECP